MLARYNDVLQGLADRLVSMAEQQAHHRQGLETAVISGNIASEKRGQVFGLIIGLTLGVGALGLVGFGHAPAGVSIIIAEVAAFAGIFVWGKSKQQKELDEKRQSPRPPST